MKQKLLLNDISECNTCVKSGNWFKYGIQSHRCAKEPCVQQGRNSYNQNKSAFDRLEFALSSCRKCNCSICCFANSIKGFL